MTLKIPNNFDINSEILDPNEIFIRDKLKLNIINWGKFRHTIHIGNDSNVLISKSGVVENNVKESYIELAKSHYEVVTSLGCSFISLTDVKNI